MTDLFLLIRFRKKKLRGNEMKKNEIVKIQKKPFPEKTYAQRELFQFQEMYGICVDPEKDLILTQSGQFVRNGHSDYNPLNIRA